MPVKCWISPFSHGFQGIELSSYHFWPERLRADEVDRMRSVIKQNGMRLAIHARHRGISFGAHDATLRQRFVEELQATVRFAADLGGDVVVAHVGEIVPPANHPTSSEQTLRQEAFQFAVDSFARCAPVAADCGVRICVENVQLRATEVITSFRRSSTARRHDRTSRRGVRSGYRACPCQWRHSSLHPSFWATPATHSSA